jgi:hypothetical protein
MMRTMLCRALRIGVAVVAALLPVTARANAASLPAHAEVRVDPCVDLEAFRQVVASRYNVEFSSVIAADIDRDGDIDVLAATGHTLTVWLNDGAGHLTSQRAPQGPAIDGRAPATTWRGHEDRPDPSTNDDAPTAPMPIARAHAPPIFATGAAALLNSSATLFTRISSSAPRAPPL